MHPKLSPFIVGIDLGTSHTVVAAVPAGEGADAIFLLQVPQRISATEVGEGSLLPSMRYQAAPGELGDAWQQPWEAEGASTESPAVIGRWARDLGAAVPQRLVTSAKSWLSHNGVDRTAPILPWGAGDDVTKVSPLAASASYLAHVVTAWNRRYPCAPLHAQTVVLTVPASFDEGARALTLEAAQLVGLTQVQLLEEPKAAFHDWLVLQGQALAQQLADSRTVLVVDVGGGTTDLTLIQVEPAADGGVPTLTRTAVGEHLMLGGDNMDLALAHQLEPQLADGGGGGRLPAARFAQLVQRCRSAKEQLLAHDAPEQVTVTLLGSGSRLLGGTKSVVLTRAQVQQWVVEGFLPMAQLADAPSKRHGALRGFGLPYPADAAISRHIAQFLHQHAGGALPDTVLLNGGVFHAHALVQRLTQQLSDWRGTPVRVLHNPHPDWAVARGAAAYGLARVQAEQAQEFARNTPPTQSQPAQTAPKSMVPHIGGGSARSYWLLLQQPKAATPQLLCLLPKGTEEGVRMVLSGRRFALKLGQAVRFALLANSRSDGAAQAGQLQSLQGEGWVELPPLSTVLPAPQGQAAAQVEVQLQACMTEVGTLEVRCLRVVDGVADPAQSWLLPFAVRGAVTTASAETGAASADVVSTSGQKELDSANARLPEAIALIDRIFGTQAQEVVTKEVRQLRQSLEKLLGPRDGWHVGVLRALFDALLARAKRRRRTAEHERVWLNLAGWCLRPGVGAELDAWRITQIWALYAQGLGHAQDAANWTEWWVFWRRVAAGLDEAQQMQVLEAVAGAMQKTVQQATQRNGGKSRYGSYDDMLRLFAAMEAVPWPYRQEMGQWMLQRLKRPDETAQTWWAIGRLAARQPLAANAHLVMPPSAAQEFLDATLEQDWRKNETAMFAAVQMARMTGDMARDLPDAVRAQVLEKMRHAGAPARWLELVEQVVQMDADDQKRSLGDSLPPGLVLL